MRPDEALAQYATAHRQLSKIFHDLYKSGKRLSDGQGLFQGMMGELAEDGRSFPVTFAGTKITFHYSCLHQERKARVTCVIRDPLKTEPVPVAVFTFDGDGRASMMQSGRDVEFGLIDDFDAHVLSCMLYKALTPEAIASARG